MSCRVVQIYDIIFMLCTCILENLKHAHLVIRYIVFFRNFKKKTFEHHVQYNQKQKDCNSKTNAMHTAADCRVKNMVYQMWVFYSHLSIISLIWWLLTFLFQTSDHYSPNFQLSLALYVANMVFIDLHFHTDEIQQCCGQECTSTSQYVSCLMNYTST